MDYEKINKARSYFQHLQNEVIYFNHASTGPFSTQVKNTLIKLLDERSSNKIDDYEQLLRISDETKNLLAVLINSTPARIAFTSNTSYGLNILAQGMYWSKGDRIILNDIEFPANVYPFMNLMKKGVEIDFVKSHNGIVTAEDIIKSITEKTKLISVSYVQFLSGYRIDLQKLGQACKERDIILSVDAIQGLGALRMDVQKCNVDFISCGTQKWLLGLQGMAFIYVSEELQNKMYTIPAGWLSVDNAWDLTDYEFLLKNSAGRYQPGTLNTFGVYSLNASLKLFEEFGFSEIENQVLQNSAYFIKQLKSIGFNPLLNNLEGKYLSGIVSIAEDDCEKLFNYLSDNKIIAAVREGIVRFAPHFYNTKQEIDKVVVDMINYSNINKQ
jgi:selenocysteine lyase/cysteine desulfurase